MPATPWPATPRHRPLSGTTAAPLRTPRSADLRCRSRRTVHRRRTWRIIITTGTSRDHTYNTREPCTTQSRSKAWELFINTDSRADFCLRFYFKRGLSTMTLQRKRWLDRETNLRWNIAVFFLLFFFLDDQECFRTGFPFTKAHKGFLITCGSIFNGHLACF